MRKVMPTVALSGAGVMFLAVPAATAGTANHKSHHKATNHKPKPAVASSLSGTWSGQYGGSFQGTFSLTWRQSGSSLNGTIKLSAPSVFLTINGTVQGSAIHFGTVGGVGVTYTGSVTSNGDSMSGSYQTAGGGGSWSATKSS